MSGLRPLPVYRRRNRRDDRRGPLWDLHRECNDEGVRKGPFCTATAGPFDRSRTGARVLGDTDDPEQVSYTVIRVDPAARPPPRPTLSRSVPTRRT